MVTTTTAGRRAEAAIIRMGTGKETVTKSAGGRLERADTTSQRKEREPAGTGMATSKEERVAMETRTVKATDRFQDAGDKGMERTDNTATTATITVTPTRAS